MDNIPSGTGSPRCVKSGLSGAVLLSVARNAGSLPTRMSWMRPDKRSSAACISAVPIPRRW